MICKGPLTPAQLASSQHNYHIFSLINGLSYMCLGETVLILLAVRLGCPDYIVSTLGAMIYFGFLLLPLGKVVTARAGAAKSQSIFWVARNAAALLVALAAVVSISGMPRTATALLLAGAFFFYGFRAAGVVMSQPLVGNITSEKDRAKVIGVNAGFFYLSCLAALVTISILLKLCDSLAMLTGIVVAGALLGFTASRFINRICETEAIRDSARKPIAGEFRLLFHDKSLLRLLASGFAVNLECRGVVPLGADFKHDRAAQDAALFVSPVARRRCALGDCSVGLQPRLPDAAVPDRGSDQCRDRELDYALFPADGAGGEARGRLDVHRGRQRRRSRHRRHAARRCAARPLHRHRGGFAADRLPALFRAVGPAAVGRDLGHLAPDAAAA